MLEVAIVEDNDIIREGFQILINDSQRYKCSWVYSNCEDFLEDLKKNKPDFVLMDIELPGMSGIDGLKKLREESVEILPIVLTVYGENERLFEAIRSGACGYMLKRSPQEKILNILDDLSRGESVMSAQIALKVIDTFGRKPNRKIKKANLSLSDCEHSILKYRIEGSSPKAIADSLTLTLSQVYTNFYNIYKKLQQFPI